MEYSHIIIRPLVSEKATAMKDEANQVTFFVNPRANKIEIRHAVEKAFNVKVTNVRVVSRKPGMRKRQGRTVGRIPGCKKAYVTLAPGAKIEFFDGV